MAANRSFKNGVFTTLFNNPDLLRELYCALEGVDLPPGLSFLYCITGKNHVLIMKY